MAPSRRRSGPVAVAFDASPLFAAKTGVGFFCREAMAALATNPEVEVGGYAVTLRGRSDLRQQLPEGVKLLGWGMPASPLNRSWARRPWPPVEWFLGKKVDVVHGTNFSVPPTRRAAAVVTVHDLTPVRFPEMCEAYTLAFPGQVQTALARGAWVHTPSQFVANEVVELLGADPDRVRAVSHGIPLAPLLESATTALPAPYVLAVGTVEPRKDYPTLLQAFNRIAAAHPDLTLVIIGSNGWGSDAFTAAVERSPFRDRVVRPGYVDDEALAGAIRGASVLAYPSVYEGFGFPPLQAMQAGVPVVATAAGAVPEVVGSAAELVPVGDESGLASALVGVLDDPDRAADLVAAGREQAAKFTWTRCADGLVDLYREATRR